MALFGSGASVRHTLRLPFSHRVKASVFRMTAIRVNCIGSCPLCKICRGSHNEVEKFEGPMTAISARLAASRLHYAWVIIALTFIVIVVIDIAISVRRDADMCGIGAIFSTSSR